MSNVLNRLKKYRKKPVVVEAVQWFKNGDHPEDDPTRGGTILNGEYREGKVVRYYRNPMIDGQKTCPLCSNIFHNHGFIDTLEGGHIVCPGDYIITGTAGKKYPCKPDIFKQTYEAVEEL